MSRLRTRLRRWLRPPRKFRLTREGRWYIGATLVLGFAAVNGGINLLFLVFGMLLCLLIANGVVSEAAMRRLRVERHLPFAIYAESPFLTGISVHNRKRRVATFSLEVEDLTADLRPVDRRCFFLKIPAGRTQETSYRRTLAERGIHHLTGLRVSTRFPFGLLRRSIDFESPADLLVYPALVPALAPVLRTGMAALGEEQHPTRTRRGEFHGLRELRPGDDLRDIHWRTTARRGRPFLREFEEETGRSIIVALANPPSADAAPWFEGAVSYAASLAIVLLRQGFRVGLAAGQSFIAPQAGASQATPILRCLALVQAGALGEDQDAIPTGFAHRATVLRVIPAQGNPRLEIAGNGARGTSA